jgi:hypothetical protein
MAFTEVHFNWRHDESYTVRYASFDGSGWSNQTIAQGILYSLALDKNDNPHIVYSATEYEGPLMYATWTGNNWTIQTVDIGGIQYASIALDSLGIPHVAYVGLDGLRYASWTGSNWSIQTVGGTSRTSCDLSLTLDSNNNPAIAYYIVLTIRYDHTAYYWTTACLKVATYKNSNWDISQNITEIPGGLGKLVFDSKGSLHMLYKLSYPERQSLLTTARCLRTSDGTAWSMQTIVSNVYVDAMDLALDSNNNPHVAFVSFQNLTYASWTGSTWEKQFVSNRTSGTQCYLALDSNDYPHLGYREWSQSETGDISNNFMYATVPEAKQSSLQISSLTIIAAVVVTAIIASTLTIVYVRRKGIKK